MGKAKPAPQAAPNPNLAAYQQDLASGRLKKYAGLYVAYDAGRFLYSGPKAAELERKVREEYIGLKKPLIIKVGDDGATSL